MSVEFHCHKVVVNLATPGFGGYYRIYDIGVCLFVNLITLPFILSFYLLYMRIFGAGLNVYNNGYIVTDFPNCMDAMEDVT